MRTAGLTAFVVVLGLGAALAVAVATPAQTVPLPVPAPKKTTGAAQAQAEQPPRPTAPIPLGPSTTAPAQRGAPVAPPAAAAAKPAKPGEATAFDSGQRAMVDKVSAYLTGMQTLVGDFVQVGPDGSRTEGQFYIQKPGKVRFEYSPPTPIDVIADGDAVVVRDRKLATQDLYPLSQTPLRFLLADKIDLLKDTNVVSVSADDMFVTVVIEEKQLVVGTNRLMLMFGAKDYQLRQWTVTDPQGYDTTVAVYNLDPTKKPDPKMFKINYERVLQ
jgi:outer membrane lipoprotein-sorting protein